MKNVWGLVLIGLLAILGAYAAWGTDSTQPHGVMIGTIVEVHPAPAGADSLGTILVAGNAAGNLADKASVTLTTKTQLLRKDGTTLRFVDLKPNTPVEVLFTGPVMESYPVQVTASKVIVQ